MPSIAWTDPKDTQIMRRIFWQAPLLATRPQCILPKSVKGTYNGHEFCDVWSFASISCITTTVYEHQ